MEQALAPPRPLCVLLLPRPLEEVPSVHALVAAPGVAAVEPAPVSRRIAARLPDAVADGLAAVQSRRLRLPGEPRAVALLDPAQYRLARALLAHHPGAELWYGGAGEGPEHDLATERAALRFDLGRDGAAPLWQALARLGIE